jgi:transcriptional regulator with XRE-family HTH domain
MTIAGIAARPPTTAYGSFTVALTQQTEVACLIVGGLGLADASTTLSVPQQPTTASAWTTPGAIFTPTERVTDQGIARAVLEIRRLAALTWEELGELLGVSRRSLHHWANGKPVSAKHYRRVMHLLSQLRQLHSGSATMMRDQLFTSNGTATATLFARLKAGEQVMPVADSALGGAVQPGESSTRLPDLGVDTPRGSPIARLETLADRPIAAAKARAGRVRPAKSRAT